MKRNGHLDSCEWDWNVSPKQHSRECQLWQDSPQKAETAEIELEFLLSLEVARAVLAHYKKKSKNTLLVSFEGWIEKEITKLQ